MHVHENVHIILLSLIRHRDGLIFAYRGFLQRPKEFSYCLSDPGTGTVTYRQITIITLPITIIIVHDRWESEGQRGFRTRAT